MTHTLEVAQIGRRLAQKIRRQYNATDLEAAGGLDPDVVEAAALVHDLGHPPFGHVAEEELQRLIDRHFLSLSGSFEGNAQSFRIVTKLAVHRASPVDPSQNYSGINLSRATLNAALKYPWERDPTLGTDRHRKWGVYETESGEFAWARDGFPPQSGARTLEADLMDWADDVAYSIHDLEDFYRAGLIPLDRLAGGQGTERDWYWQRYTGRLKREREKQGKDIDDEFIASLDILRRSFDDLMETIAELFFITEPFNDSRAHRGYLRDLTSAFIDRYINALTLLSEPDENGSWVRPDEDLGRQVKLLKSLTWEYVIDGPALASQQQGQRRIIRTLFLTFTRAVRRHEDWKVFPRPYQEELTRAEKEDEEVEARKVRTVVDFIASMTEQQAYRVHQRVTGQTSGSILGPY